MKKQLLAIAASLLFLTACAGKTGTETAETVSETTAATSASATVVTTEDTTSETEEEHVFEERKLRDLTVQIDLSLLVPPEEYIEDLKERGIELDDQIIQEITGTDIAEIVYAVKDSDVLFIISEQDFDDFEGFFTKEKYELYAEVIDSVQEQDDGVRQSRSKVDERNGLMYVETVVTFKDGDKGHICTIMKDGVQYMFVLSGNIRSKDRNALYSVLDTSVFD